MLFNTGEADAEILFPAEVNISKNPSGAGDSLVSLSQETLWHICLVRQASGASVTSNGECYLKKSA